MGLPMVIGAASVKPEDAASNVAAWLHLIGIVHLPAWLSAPGADNRIIFGSLGIGTVYAFLVWGVPALRAKKERLTEPSVKRGVADTFTEGEKQRRIQLIREARQFVVRATASKGIGTDFKRELEAYAPYFELRPHLSAEFRAKMNAQRTLFAPGHGTRLPALATFFLDELDSLEGKWGLRDGPAPIKYPPV
jgi:hypothetical protein